MKFKPSLLGYTQGGAGNVVVSNWKGSAYLRSKSTKFNTTQTPAQEAHRAKFKLMMQTLKRAKSIIDLGFQNFTQKQSSINAAMSANMRTAFAGEFPELSIDFTQLKLSVGVQWQLDQASANSTETSILHVEWVSGTTSDSRKPEDLVLVHAFCPEINESVSDVSLAVRGDELLDLALPDYYSGKAVHVIIGVVNPKTGIASNSQYIGEVLIA